MRTETRTMKSEFTASRLEQAPSLSSTLVERLREEISSSRLDIGSRFPTEAEISSAYGVSRAVVREAVAALRAEGLVTTQRGRGSVVAARVPTQPFGISQEEIQTRDDVLRVFELRRALESEAATLAAQRRTRQDLAAIKKCLKRFQVAIDKGQHAIDEDIDLHLAIAVATQNDFFPRLMASFRTIFISRRRLRTDLNDGETRRIYLTQVQSQHLLIVDAIEKCDAHAASKLMRKHLDGSRYADPSMRSD